MQNEKECFYYPNPANKKERMYVRENDEGDIEFRLWNADYPEVWERHGWLDLDMIHRAVEIYESKHGDNPLELYDANIARAVIQDTRK